MESDNADGEVFLFTSESVGEGHPGKIKIRIYFKYKLKVKFLFR
jgi:hypothetical protein